MFDYILDYLENRNIYSCSKAEQEKLEQGIRVFLEANGIAADEERIFYRNMIKRILDTVSTNDLKKYLTNYELIVKVNLLLCEIKNDNGANQSQKEKMLELMTQLNETGLYDKYVPASEIATMNL